MHASQMSDYEREMVWCREREREREYSYSPRVTAEEPGRVLGAEGVPWAVWEDRGLDSRGEQRGQVRCESEGKAGS